MVSFVDSSFIVALFVKNEEKHDLACEIFDKIKDHNLIISKLVIAETVTVLKNKISTKEIREIYWNIHDIFYIYDDYEMFDDAMKEFVKYDASISFFDAMYVAIMKKEGIHEILTIDSDFDKVDGIVRVK